MITTTIEPLRRRFNLTRDEYAFAEYIQQRSADPRQIMPGWCCDSKESVADFVGITRQGLYRMAAKIKGLGIIEVGPNGFYRVSTKWIDAKSAATSLDAEIKETLCQQSLHVSTKFTGVNKVYRCQQSLHENATSVNKVDSGINVIDNSALFFGENSLNFAKNDVEGIEFDEKFAFEKRKKEAKKEKIPHHVKKEVEVLNNTTVYSSIIKSTLIKEKIKKEKINPNFSSEIFAENSDSLKSDICVPKNGRSKERVEMPECLKTASFIEAWERLLTGPKWKNKTASMLNLALKKLAKYPPSFAADLCDNAHAGNFQGVVYSSTDKDFQAWQRAQNNLPNNILNNAKRDDKTGHAGLAEYIRASTIRAYEITGSDQAEVGANGASW